MSAVEREFNTRYNKLAERANLGPGSYDVEKSLNNPKVKQITTIYTDSKTTGEQGNESVESENEVESEGEVFCYYKDRK